MDFQIPDIQYGQLLFIKRIEKNITQQKLAEGICSIPYLSKLENGKITSNREIVELLFKKVNINLDELKHQYDEIFGHLSELYDALSAKDYHKIEQHRYVIRDYQNYTLPPEIYYLVQLFRLRCYLFDHDIENSKKLLTYIATFEKNMSEQVKAYFNYFKGIYYVKMANYISAIKYLKSAEKALVRMDHGNSNADLYYHLSFAHCRLYNTTMAIYYGEKALNIFSSELKYERIIESQIIIAISYIQLGFYCEAREKLDAIILKSKQFNFNHLYVSGLYNLACLEGEIGNSKKSMDDYRKCLAFDITSEELYFQIIINLSNQLVKVNKQPEAIQIIKGIINGTIKYRLTQDYIYRATVYYLYIQEIHSDLLELLETKIIPYFHNRNDILVLNEIYYIAARSSELTRRYKKSSMYYKKIITQISSDFPITRPIHPL